jgi:hypothetical protein
VLAVLGISLQVEALQQTQVEMVAPVAVEAEAPVEQAEQAATAVSFYTIKLN